MNVTLSHDQITKLSSHYISDGLKNERWRMDEVEISQDKASAQISMQSYCTSDRDGNRFHLSIFSALEMVSQLTIIFMHHQAGLSEKSREVWFIEGSQRNVRPIRNPNLIEVKMQVIKIRKRGYTMVCQADYQVYDDQDGLFEFKIKGFMS